MNGTYSDPSDPAVAFSGERRFWKYLTRQLSDRLTAKVNVGTGNLLLKEEDLSVSGVAGWDLGLTRSYNSLSREETYSRMGVGWSHDLGGSVRLQLPDADTALFWGPSGYRAEFNKRDGRWQGTDEDPQTPGPGIKADLDFDADAGVNGHYVLTWYDKSKYVFDADGDLLRMVDKNDNTLQMSYASKVDGAPPVISEVTDTRDRVLEFNYGTTDSGPGGADESGLVVETVLYDDAPDQGGTVLKRFEYEYSQTIPARLTSVTLAEVNDQALGTAEAGDANVGATTTYEYDDGGRLTKVTDPRTNGSPTEPGTAAGGTTEFTYSDDRVARMIRRTDDDGDIPDSEVDLTYYEKADPSPNGACRGGDERAATRTLVDGERNNATDTADLTQYCVDDLGRILRTTDAKGHERNQSYDPQSNVVSASLTGTGSGNFDTSFDDNDNPNEHTTPKGSRSAASYGNAPTRTAPPRSAATTPTATTPVGSTPTTTRTT